MAIRETGTPLKVLIKRLKLIENGVAKATLCKNLAVEARTQVMNEFRGGRDPYGNAWAPVKRKGRKGGKLLKDVRYGAKPLLKTGRLRASFRGEPTSKGFTVVTNVVYGAIQNYGGHGITARPMVPEGKVGPIWNRAFVRVTNKVIKSLLETGKP